jgi:hypothetical protein
VLPPVFKPFSNGFLKDFPPVDDLEVTNYEIFNSNLEVFPSELVTVLWSFFHVDSQPSSFNLSVGYNPSPVLADRLRIADKLWYTKLSRFIICPA